MPVLNTIADRHEDMKVWRHALHAHPELGLKKNGPHNSLPINWKPLALKPIVVWPRQGWLASSMVKVIIQAA